MNDFCQFDNSYLQTRFPEETHVLIIHGDADPVRHPLHLLRQLNLPARPSTRFVSPPPRQDGKEDLTASFRFLYLPFDLHCPRRIVDARRDPGQGPQLGFETFHPSLLLGAQLARGRQASAGAQGPRG